MITDWLRAIRVKFLLASMIAVLVGLSVTYWKIGHIDYIYSLLTILGVASLHASIDLLNDYWDYVRGIDKYTKKTRFSGGSWSITRECIHPRTVYIAGIVFLCVGVDCLVYIS